MAVSHVAPAVGPGPTVATSVSAGAPAAPPPAASGAAAPVPSAPPPAAAQGVFPYMVGGGGPGPGFGSGHTRTATAVSRLKAPERDIAAVAAATAARRRSRRRRQQDAVMRGYADEYTDLDTDILASDRGGGPMGFAGTVSKQAAHAAGLTALTGDAFGGGPTVPMVPGTWDPDRDPAAPER
ncbi:hypothetical protein [Mycobacterium sp.]|uniref:PPW family C-terminal domain-containing PPE protein n=1 Tax=Mycobacterium sp. TaxID=1785 RepID=UPI003F9AFA98